MKLTKLLTLIGLSGCTPLEGNNLENYLETRETIEQYSTFIEDLTEAADPEYVFTANTSGDSEAFMDEYYKAKEILDKTYDHGKIHPLDSKTSCGKYLGNGTTHRIKLNFDQDCDDAYVHEACHGLDYFANLHDTGYELLREGLDHSSENYLILTSEHQDTCGLISFYDSISNGVVADSQGSSEAFCQSNLDSFFNYYDDEEALDNFRQSYIDNDCDNFYIDAYYNFPGISLLGISKDEADDIFERSGLCEYSKKVCAQVLEDYSN
jgi:hypothetical protein